MKFIEAINDMVTNRAYVSRDGWTDGSYLVCMPGMTYIWKVSNVPNPAAGNWLPFIDDLLAEDWKVL
jgi:hypothetical protein